MECDKEGRHQHATPTWEQKEAPPFVGRTLGVDTCPERKASGEARPRAVFCHFSLFFQCVLKYFLQGVVNYWSIFRIKTNLVTKKKFLFKTL